MKTNATATRSTTESDPRWTSIVTRDARTDGRFWYSVRTTGVYCRPSCAARLPRPENVAFHATTADAEKAGFRACKRCKPGIPSTARLDVRTGGGTEDEVRFTVGPCDLGLMLVAYGDSGLGAILFGDDADALSHELHRRFPDVRLVSDDSGLENVFAQVGRFVGNPASGLDLPLDIRGTAFQQRVWQALRAIPAGSTASYRDVAERIESPNAVRAVAGACAANPIAVAIPCHRVITSDGGLSGYRWGVERKRRLLEREMQA